MRDVVDRLREMDIPTNPIRLRRRRAKPRLGANPRRPLPASRRGRDGDERRAARCRVAGRRRGWDSQPVDEACSGCRSGHHGRRAPDPAKAERYETAYRPYRTLFDALAPLAPADRRLNDQDKDTLDSLLAGKLRDPDDGGLAHPAVTVVDRARPRPRGDLARHAARARRAPRGRERPHTRRILGERVEPRSAAARSRDRPARAPGARPRGGQPGDCEDPRRRRANRDRRGLHQRLDQIRRLPDRQALCRLRDRALDERLHLGAAAITENGLKKSVARRRPTASSSTSTSSRRRRCG